MSPVDRHHIATDTDSDAICVVFQFLKLSEGESKHCLVWGGLCDRIFY